MAASDRPTITFYDILLDPKVYPPSPNPWKSRYVLNFAKTPYRTAWVPFPAVAATRQSLNLAPVRKHPNGTDFPTLPILRDPLAAGPAGSEVLVGDSFDIAVHLQTAYLSQRPEQPQLFPSESPAAAAKEDDHGTVAWHRAFNKLVDDLFAQYVALAIDGLPLDPATAEADKASFVSRIPGCAKWDELAIPMGTERRRKMLADFEKAMDEQLASHFPRCSSGESEGSPFVDGREAPMYADFIVGGWLQFMRGCLPEWEEMRNKWSGGQWGRLFDALEPWTQVDGRDGVVPARR